MTNPIYAKMAETALRLLTSYGQPITLIRNRGTDKDPVTGEAAADAEAEASLDTIGLLKLYQSSLVDGSRIQAGDRELVLTAEVAPDFADKVQIGDDLWTIQNVKPVAPAGPAIVYFLQVRK